MEQRPAALGARLRELRRERGLSIRGLAAELGCSASHISQLERGLSEPSVGLLTALAAALGVPMDALFPRPQDGAAEADRQPRVRRAHRRPERTVGPGVRAQLLGPEEDGQAGFCEYVYAPGAHPPAEAASAGRVYGVVTEGTLDVEFADRVVTLREGDSIVFDPALPHRFHNRALAPARMIRFARP